MKYLVKILQYFIRLLTCGIFIISELIKLIKWVIQLILKMFLCLCTIICLAAITLEALSDTITTNLLELTLSIISKIISDMLCEIWCSFERSSRHKIYSFLKDVIRRKVQMLLPQGSI